jgi:tRNA (guanine37-N1)-methyltransferase
MRIDIITIFPKMFDAVLNESIIKRAQSKGKVKIVVHDLRAYSLDKHKKVDDRPFGGGAGMVMRPEPIFACIKALKKTRQAKVMLMGPRGKTLTQAVAKRISKIKQLILVCGHYEGIDERVKLKLVDEEISIGDYVLTGGELPAMVLVDAIVRLLPGVLGDKNSLIFESFQGNLLEYPQYTRPANFKGMKVPAVLLSGNHKNIQDWRKEKAIETTKKNRPDLLTQI